MIKPWQVLNNLYDSCLHTDNGKKYGKGFKEAQIRQYKGHYSLSLSDGYKIYSIKYNIESIEKAKELGEIELQKAA
jgi:hypothetical protein